MSAIAQFLPLALALVMLSLGLSLTLADFRRVLAFPRAVMIALLCQVLLLPLICFLLVEGFSLPSHLAVGMLLLAATPGGAIANLFSHLANGDLALNIALTAINSLLSVVTLPLILVFAAGHFLGEQRGFAPQFAKLMQVLAFVIVPVAIGMLLRARFTALAIKLGKAVKLAAAAFVSLAATIAVVSAWSAMLAYLAELGAVVLLFNLISLAVGYGVPRLARLERRQAVAISMEVGLHNSALAIAIALSPFMLGNPLMAVPPTFYGVLSLFTAAAFACLISRRAAA